MLRKDYKSPLVLEGRTVMGYCAVFNNIDAARDKISPGAFRRSIKENGPEGKNRIVFLNQHDKRQLLGKPTVMKEDAVGLYIEAPIISTSYGEDALQLVAAGILDGMSIGYETIDQIQKPKYNDLRELKLIEFSLVTFPCNDLARVTDLKDGLFDAVDMGDPEDAADLLSQLAKQFPGALTDEQMFVKELMILADDRMDESDSWAGLIKSLSNNL